MSRANSLANRAVDATSVMDQGAIGNGVADDTAAIQAAINNASGGVLYLPFGRNFKITDLLSVAASITIIGYGSTITQATSGKGCFSVSSSGVRIVGVKMVGPQYAASNASEIAVKAAGANSSSYISDITVRDCVIQSWGKDAIQFTYVTKSQVEANNISNIYYAGFEGLSVTFTDITANKVDNVVGTPNAYGISLSRLTSDSIVTEPRSADCSVIGNTVRNVANWEAYDTHGGQRITFMGNRAYNCKFGIALVPALGTTTGVSQSPLDCTLIGNILDSGVTDGSRSSGIVINGDPNTIGSSYTKAKNISVTGNTVRGFGTQSATTVGGLMMRDTDSVTIQGNNFVECSPIGICLYHDNFDFNIEGNAITDTWTNNGTVANAYAIRVEDAYNKGYIGQNSACADTFSATYVNTVGLYINPNANNAIEVGNFYCEAATRITDTGNRATNTPTRFPLTHGYLGKGITANGASATFTYPANTTYHYITTSAASLTVTLPATSAALDGLCITFVTNSAVGTLAWVAGSGGATIIGAPSSCVGNVPIRMIYHHATTQWLPA